MDMLGLCNELDIVPVWHSVGLQDLFKAVQRIPVNKQDLVLVKLDFLLL